MSGTDHARGCCVLASRCVWHRAPLRDALRHPVQLGQALVLSLALLAALAGCQAAGYVAQVVGGGEKIEARYEPLDRPTLIMVDDSMENPRLPTRELGMLIADRVGGMLVDKQVLSSYIEPTRVARLAADDPDFHKRSIVDIGKQLGAEQVIYIGMDAFYLTEDGHMYQPFAQAHVKVIDTAGDGARLFPADADGLAVAVQQSYRSMEGATATTHRIISERLAEEFAEKIAKLFFEHKAPEPGQRLPG